MRGTTTPLLVFSATSPTLKKIPPPDVCMLLGIVVKAVLFPVRRTIHIRSFGLWRQLFMIEMANETGNVIRFVKWVVAI